MQNLCGIFFCSLRLIPPKRLPVFARGIIFSLAALAGCGEQSFPKGTGASGTLTGVVAKADSGVELINKLSADRQVAFDWMHQPVEKAIIVDDLADASSASWRAKVTEGWNELAFAKVREDERYDDFAQVVTSAGSFRIGINVTHSPNHARNLILLIKHGFFDRKKLVLEDGIAFIDVSSQELGYSLRPEIFPMIPVRGAIIVEKDGEDRSHSGRIGFCLRNRPDLAGKVTIIAGIDGPEAEPVLDRINQELEQTPGSVMVESIEWTRRQGPLFLADGSIRLPTIGADGRPVVGTPGEDASVLPSEASDPDRLEPPRN